ncbi:HD domain-containing phosphohydrolase [Isoptericola aurantiacus]|uniref:HD domain-containing phosphohydrolase n=1 Tax=Isoptericola aurantiacus TaxID=3377839 RepID=UPI00383B54DC
MAGDGTSATAQPVRAAEVASALCLATDLGLGFPWAHGLEATAAAMRLSDLADADPATRKQAYFLSLLLFAGCTADASEKAALFGGPTEPIIGVIWGGTLEQMRVVLRALPEPDAPAVVGLGQAGARLPRALAQHRREQLALCEVAQHMAEHLGLGTVVGDALAHLTDRWDGAGVLRRGRGDEIPLALRIALVARDASYQAVLGGTERAAAVVTRRAGKAHDPRLARLVANHHREVLVGDDDGPVAARVLAAEPGDPVLLAGDRIDDALSTLGEVADLMTPPVAGRSRAVAALAARAAQAAGLAVAEVDVVRRAALLQDVGRVTVPPPVWRRPGRLGADEWEQVRLHPYYTGRVCSMSSFLRPLGAVAACHHERLDGSGYHRGVGASALGVPARILAAADAWRFLREPAPYGRALGPDAAAGELAQQVAAGQLDADGVAAVVTASGTAAPPLHRPAGLTEREVRVLGLAARGLATKQVGRALGISPKTVDQHLQHAYRKIGTSSRAAATLFAAEHGLLAWGELPIHREGAAT